MRKSFIIGLLGILLVCAGHARAQERVNVSTADPAYVNSIVLSTSPNPTSPDSSRAPEPSFFGLRVLLFRQGATLEESPPLERIALFGPHAPDGTYARVHWELPFERKLVTLQWARVGPRTVVGKFSSQARVQLALEAYQPFAPPGTAPGNRRLNLRAQDVRTLLGEQVGLLTGPARPLRWLVRTERAASGAVSYNDAAALRATLVKEGRALPPEADGGTVYGLQRFSALSFELNERESVGFVMVLGEEVAALEREADQTLRTPLNQWLEEAENRYETTRPRSTGWLSDALESLSRIVSWNRVYLPELRSEFASAWRAPAVARSGNSSISLQWDGFFRALTAALVDPPQANATVRAMLARQSSDGRLAPGTAPLAGTPGHEVAVLAGRSMPPAGALSVWKVYLATQDLSLLTATYPRLKRWHEWWLTDRGDGQAWRDGNGDGLLEGGYDAALEVGELGARQMPIALKQQIAAAESGLDDKGQLDAGAEAAKPLYNEKTHTLERTPIGLNALYALETEILHAMAAELGLKEDVDKWAAQYGYLKQALDTRLWSEKDKLYLSRNWNGAFTTRLTPETFYVLAAGIPSPERAAQIVEVLRDSKKFGGVPYLPADGPNAAQTGQERGRVSALTNYLVYLGLKRYGFQPEAAHLARQSTQLVRDAWLREAKVFDSFAHTVQSPAEGMSFTYSQSGLWFGGLMWLPGIEELLALDPLTGLTIGNEAVTEEARLINLPLAGSVYDIAIGPQQLAVTRNGQLELEVEAPTRLYNYQSREHTLSFLNHTSKPLNFRVPAGKREIAVSVDDKLVDTWPPGKIARFKLTSGAHRVVIVK